MLKYLRIAVSALGLTACLLLVALWARSYWWRDVLERVTTSQVIQIHSHSGCMEVRQYRPGRNPRATPALVSLMLKGISHGKTFDSHPIIGQRKYPWRAGFFGVGQIERGSGTIVFGPYWIPVLLSGMLAVVPWIPWSPRFGLRTLLIATTLVAVVLGIVVAVR